MSNFFDSEIIQEELEEINDLQKEVYQKAFQRMNREDQKEHVELLIQLLEKQKIMYTRLSLSDDPQAVKMKEQLRKSVTIMGFPEGTDINVLFDGMKKTIEKLKERVD
tara:strand:- start:143 stop:466 length:324 start_codon:yes stop_codon:yes gene_type:complete